MTALDTNILVRFLIGDDAVQAEKVYALLKKAESEKREFFVPLLVIQELIWVLESVYDIARQDILNSIDDLLLMPVLKFEQQTALHQFIHHAQNSKYDLPDLLIAHSVREQGGDTILTFDRKASKYDLFALVA